MKKTKIVSLFLFLSIICSPFMVSSTDYEVDEVFSLALLSPNTLAARNQWALLMEIQLPKIGIGVYYHESTGWGNIAPRTWSYPLMDYDYIPTYAEGGFDILFVGWSWGLDWDPSGHFDTASVIPFGDNFYQYSNPFYDAILSDYLTEMDQATQIAYARQLQEILYEDLPAITILYMKDLYGFKEGITGIDPILLSAGIPCYEYWDEETDHIIKYAIPSQLNEWNTYVQESFYDGLWMHGVYGELFKRTQVSNTWELQIAAHLPIYTSDLKSMSVDIDPNAKFSDGSAVLAEDVAFSAQLYMTPAVNSYDYSQFCYWFGSNNSIYAEDIDTVCFNMTHINAFALDLISYPIIDKSTVEPLIASHGYSIFNEIPLTGNVGNALVKSCGPMVLESFDTAASTVNLSPNSYYGDTNYCDNALLDQLIFTYISGKNYAVSELVAGNIDIVDSNYGLIFDDLTPAGVEGVAVINPSEQEMALNMRHPVFGTGELTPVGTKEAAKYVRKAISHAIPRQKIVDEILGGLGQAGVTPCSPICVAFDHSLEPYTYDLDLALEYMELAGFQVTKPITPTTTETKTTSNGTTKTIGDNWIIGIMLICLVGLTATQIYRKMK